MLRQPLWLAASPSSSRVLLTGQRYSSSLVSRVTWQRGQQLHPCDGVATRSLTSSVRALGTMSPVSSPMILSAVRSSNPSLRFMYHHNLSNFPSYSWNRPNLIVFRSFSSEAVTTTATAEASSTTAAANATPAAKAKASNKWWRRLAWLVKYTRIPVIIIGIYGLGYQQGIIDYAREPQQLQQGLLLHALSGLGVTSMDQVDILRVSSSRRLDHDNDGEIQEEHPTRRGWFLQRRKTAMVVLNRTNTINSLTNQQVAMIGHHMVHAAQIFVRSELAKAQLAAGQEVESPESKTTAALSFPIKPKQEQPKSKQMADENPSEDEAVEFWLQAQRRLEGGDWQYVLVETPIPNAFVAEILPRRIFVTTGLLESLATRQQNANMAPGKKRMANGFVANSDELALVLGHEVSHLILGHVSKRNQIEALLRTLEVLFLTLDPTEGLLSLYIVTILAGIRAAVSAAYSRDDEREADELGMLLCAMAGCDLNKACHVFYKMAQAEGGVDQTSVMSSHPPTMERYEFLTEKAKELTKIQLEQGDVRKSQLSFR